MDTARPHRTEGTPRVAVVGYGLGGRVFHVPVAAEAGLEVSHVVTSNPERAAQVREAAPGARVLASLAALLADDAPRRRRHDAVGAARRARGRLTGCRQVDKPATDGGERSSSVERTGGRSRSARTGAGTTSSARCAPCSAGLFGTVHSSSGAGSAGAPSR